ADLLAASPRPGAPPAAVEAPAAAWACSPAYPCRVAASAQPASRLTTAAGKLASCAMRSRMAQSIESDGHCEKLGACSRRRTDDRVSAACSRVLGSRSALRYARSHAASIARL